MLFQKINLEQEDENVYLDAYVADEIPGFTRKAIRVIPGGGYGAVCSDREGEQMLLIRVARCLGKELKIQLH